MNHRILFEIQPSESERRSQSLLGYLSASFASLLFCFVLFAGITGKIGVWAIILTGASVLLFLAIAVVVFHLGKEYLFGIRIYEDGIGLYHPLKKAQEHPDFFVPYTVIELLELEEKLELHRTGRRVKRFHVYRIHIRKAGRESELFAEMTGLMSSEMLKFRQLPDFLAENKLLTDDRIDREKLP